MTCVDEDESPYLIESLMYVNQIFLYLLQAAFLRGHSRVTD